MMMVGEGDADGDDSGDWSNSDKTVRLRTGDDGDGGGYSLRCQ